LAVWFEHFPHSQESGGAVFLGIGISHVEVLGKRILPTLFTCGFKDVLRTNSRLCQFLFAGILYSAIIRGNRAVGVLDALGVLVGFLLLPPLIIFACFNLKRLAHGVVLG